MRTGFRTLMSALAVAGLLAAAPARAEDAEVAPAPYDLTAVDCGELDTEAGFRPLRPSHIAGEDQDILCKVTVSLSAKSKGAPKAHTVKLTITQGQKSTFEQVRDVRLLAVGSRVILFVVPAEKLPTDAGKVSLRVELSKPVNKPGSKDLTYDLVSED
jgi:hypothetical protein